MVRNLDRRDACQDGHVQESQESDVAKQLSVIHHTSKGVPFSHDVCKRGGEGVSAISRSLLS